mmetsp:Transcript_80121/g.166669  ORF Transcript_80121/g.166669 Transcript_80121/m.166669 type:complete len:263 (-) Transcript_80121:1419-2207(-)
MHSQQQRPQDPGFQAVRSEAVEGAWVHHGVVVPRKSHGIRRKHRRRRRLGGFGFREVRRFEVEAFLRRCCHCCRLDSSKHSLLAPTFFLEYSVEEDCEGEVGGRDLVAVHVLKMHLLLHAEDLPVEIDFSRLRVAADEVHVLLHMRRPHVLHSVEANAANACIQERLEVLAMHVDDLLAVPKLGPLAIAPALIAVVVVPVRSTHVEPRPLEVIRTKRWPDGLRELLLQSREFVRLSLGVAPLVAACHNDHVVEDNITDDHES